MDKRDHDEDELRQREAEDNQPVKLRQIYIDPGEKDRGAASVWETNETGLRGLYIVERRATAAGKWSSTVVQGEPHMEPKDVLALAPEAAPEALERAEEMAAEAAVHTTKNADIDKQETARQKRATKRG